MVAMVADELLPPIKPKLADSGTLYHTTADRDVAQSFSFTFMLAEKM